MLHPRQRLDSYGIAWRSYTEQYWDSTGIFKDAVISIMATIAKQENIRRSERIDASNFTVLSAATRFATQSIPAGRVHVFWFRGIKRRDSLCNSVRAFYLHLTARVHGIKRFYLGYYYLYYSSAMTTAPNG
jgi:hypothetical protein